MDILLQGKKGFQTIIEYYLVVLSLGLYILEELCCVTQKKNPFQGASPGRSAVSWQYKLQCLRWVKALNSEVLHCLWAPLTND